MLLSLIAQKKSKANNIPSKFMNVTRKFSKEFDKGNGAMNWNTLLRKLGYTGIADKSRKGIIHQSEPTQAIFLSKNAFIVVDKVLNKRYSEDIVFVNFAETKDADYGIKNNIFVWENGIWEDGTWNLGIWKDGTWEDGTWEDGTWNNGTWKIGIWKDGTWKNGNWKNGLWKDGTWKNGNWENGTWFDGLWKDGTRLGGVWKKGTWEGGVWKDGIWKDGTWLGGTWLGGKDKNGTYHLEGDSPDKWEDSEFL